METARAAHFASTAPNTSANSKNNNKTPEEYSDVKTFNYILESPCLEKKFLEHDNLQNSRSLFASTLKTIEKS